MQNVSIFNPSLPDPQTSYVWQGLYGSSIGLAIANSIKQAKGPLLIIAPDNLMVSHLQDAIIFFQGSAAQLLPFPDWETLPYDHFSPHQDIISERLAALYQLPRLSSGTIITTIATLMQRLPPTVFLDAHRFLLKIGDQLNPDILRTRLVISSQNSLDLE